MHAHTHAHTRVHLYTHEESMQVCAATLTVFCLMPIVDVGLKPIRMTMSSPFDRPPCTPPLRLVRVRTCVRAHTHTHTHTHTHQNLSFSTLLSLLSPSADVFPCTLVAESAGPCQPVITGLCVCLCVCICVCACVVCSHLSVLCHVELIIVF